MARLGALYQATGAVPSTIDTADYPDHLIAAFLADPTVDAQDLEAMRRSPLVIRSLFLRRQRQDNPLNRVPEDVIGNIAQYMDTPRNVSSLFEEFYVHGGLHGVRTLPTDHTRARRFTQLVALLEVAVRRGQAGGAAGPVVSWMMCTAVGRVLVEAAHYNNLALIKQLFLSNPRPNVDARADHGLTALIFASCIGHLPLVQVLLTAKADVHAQITDGRTALDLALDRGHVEVAQLLQSLTTTPSP